MSLNWVQIDTFSSRTTSSTTRIETWRNGYFRRWIIVFQNYIQHNKDWNIAGHRACPVNLFLPELHPAQQGLKLCICFPIVISYCNFQNYIQHNKDWNCLGDPCVRVWAIFQNYIQHNKDWNTAQQSLPGCRNTLPELHPAQQGLKPPCPPTVIFGSMSSRTTSSTTRIETFNQCLLYFFNRNLPELHPAQQGLKHIGSNRFLIISQLPELHPAQQGLKQAGARKIGSSMGSSRTTSSTTRIETRPNGRT